MALKHSVYDTDTHFSINPITRALKNEGCTKNVLIQFDHNSERMTFEIPRRIEGHDMSKCDVIEVHYGNVDSKTKEQSLGIYTVDDMQISPDDEEVVIFSWLVSHNATRYVGSLNFLIRFACSEDGHPVYVWNTAINSSISVTTGMDNGDAIVEEYPEIFAELVGRVTASENNIADILYAQNPLTITTFASNPKNARIGQTVTDVTFSWAFNQTPKSVTLCNKDGYTITSHSVDSEGTTLSGQSVKNDTKWKLKVTDKKDKEVTKETSITFLHGVYYGVGAARNTYDSAFVNGLSVDWRTSKKPSVTLSPKKQHIYYCLPTWMGGCSFSVGVLPGGFELAGTIQFTNEYGYEQLYYIYKSVELLDKTGIVVNIS